MPIVSGQIFQYACVAAFCLLAYRLLYRRADEEVKRPRARVGTNPHHGLPLLTHGLVVASLQTRCGVCTGATLIYVGFGARSSMLQHGRRARDKPKYERQCIDVQGLSAHVICQLFKVWLRLWRSALFANMHCAAFVTNSWFSH